MTITYATRQRLNQSLDDLEFRPSAGNSHRRNGLVARSSLRWFILESTANRKLDPLGTESQRSGLWKLVAPRSGEVPRWEFHLPLSVFDDCASDEFEQHGANSLQTTVQWALATAEGKLPDGWAPPERSQVETWIPEGGLSVETGPFVRQGMIHNSSVENVKNTEPPDADRLQVVFPLVHELASELSEARRSWLRTVLLDAQARWHMVRIVMNPEGVKPAVEARIDLSGVPNMIVEELFQFSMDALRLAASELLWPVGFLSEPGVTCQGWEIPPKNFFKKEKKR